MLDILKKSVDELQALFDNNRDQLNHLLGRLAQAKELYEAAKKASAAEIADGVVAGFEKIKADEDAPQAPAEGKEHAAG
jgi:hypothetical protein